MISASLEAFLTGLIDYAGLFPPAQLPLKEAIENYGRYRHTPDNWMLSRFIIPTTQLDELSQTGQPLFSAVSPFPFSVLGRGGKTADEFCANLQTDLTDIARFRQENGNQVVVDVFEVRLPSANLMAETADLLACHGLRAFFETAVTPQDPNYIHKIATSVETIAQSSASGQVGKPVSDSFSIQHSLFSISRVGFKLRTGGTESSAFPTSTQIATVLLACRDAQVSFKATAGLHHPIRHFNHSVQTKMHGFLNVFGAGILAHVHNLDFATTQAILEDETATHFQFSDDTFSWCDLKAKTAEIAHIRQHDLLSYGSCSFDEPREDLQQLGLLPITIQ